MKSVMLLIAVAAIALPGIAMAKMSTPEELRATAMQAYGLKPGQMICKLNPGHPRIEVGADFCDAAGNIGDPCRCKSTAGWLKGTVKAMP
jgi:hypothetical protein